jgi:5-methylcytosine-specific restriction endonuclease McrA
MKQCKKCNLPKPIESFTVDVRYKDGRYPWCFECRKTWRDGRKDKQRELHTNWREQNRDHVRTESLGYYYAHRDEELVKRRARQRERWQNDPAYRAKKNAFKKERYHSNPEFNAKKRGWAVVTSHRRRMRVRGTASHFSQAEWRALCAKYNHCCLCCGQQKPLSPDHVVPIARGGLNGIDNIQPLCRQCNQAKGTKTIDYRPGGSS